MNTHDYWTKEHRQTLIRIANEKGISVIDAFDGTISFRDDLKRPKDDFDKLLDDIFELAADEIIKRRKTEGSK